MSKKRKSFPVYMDWKPAIEKLSAEEVKLMVIGMMEFYDDGVIPEIDEDKYPRLDMFFTDKLPHMARLEEDRIKKLQEYQGDSKSLQESLGEKRRVKEAVNVRVGVNVPVPVNASVPSNVDVPVTQSKRIEHWKNVFGE